MQRVLFIGKRFYTNKDALDERFGRIYQLPYHWSRRDLDVRLWLVDYHSCEVRELHDGRLSVVSAPLFGLRSLRSFLAACLCFRPQAVVASGDCYIGLLGWLLAGLCEGSFFFDIYDKYDEFSGYRKLAGFDLFGFLRRRSALRFYASTLLARSLENGSGEGQVIVPNGVNDGQFAPMPLEACRARLGLPMEAKLVGYFGSMEPARGISDLIEAVGYLRKEGADIRLLACGTPSPEMIGSEQWVIYCGSVPHARVPVYINACDVVAIPYRLSALLDASASCKIAEYLMCQRPMVSTRTPNFLENFAAEANDLGEGLCRPADPMDLARAIAWQLREKRLLRVPVELSWERIANTAELAMRSRISAPSILIT